MRERGAVVGEQEADAGSRGEDGSSSMDEHGDEQGDEHGDEHAGEAPGSGSVEPGSDTRSESLLARVTEWAAQGDSQPTSSVDGGTHPAAGDGHRAGTTDALATQPSELAARQGTRYRQGELVSRYVVVSVLGEGGMGTVYLAYDPELDRRVAIKVLRTHRASERARRRLVREARVLAQLSHPNVVQVHDAGVYEGDVFVAMEYVAGSSVKRWCNDGAPGWREVLDAYLDAGKGLAAAHDKGLVHRDIKPSNLLRGADGRVRVVDFGLARGRHESGGDESGGDESGGDESEEGESGSSPSGEGAAGEGTAGEAPTSTPSDSSSWRSAARLDGRLNDELTGSEAIMGTPAYMAPEQHFDGKVGAAADQYGFCVALYRSLYGAFPFEVPRNGSWLALARRKLAGRLLEPPAGSEVPAWIHQALLRGLAPVPEERYPSMHALLAVLADDPLVRRRARVRRGLLAGAMVALSCLAGWGLWARWGAVAPCADARGQLSAVWNEQTAERMRRAFVATGAAYAPDMAARTIAVLDAYASEWAAMRGAVCEARQAGAGGLDAGALRDVCLERRRGQLGALVDVLVHEADDAVVQNAVEAAVTLPPIAYCADVEALSARVRPPEDPALRARVDGLRPQVDRLEAQYEAGTYERGLAGSASLLAALETLDHAPIRARAVYWTARLRDGMGDYAGAEEMLRQAIRLAARGGDEVLMIDAWSSLLFVVGYRQQRLDDARDVMEWLDVVMALAGDEAARAHALGTQAIVVKQMGRYEEAKALYEQALRIQERTLGPDHPRVATALNNLALVLERLGDYEEAQAMYERSLAIKERTLGPEHPKLTTAFNNLANLLHRRGRYEQARVLHERSLAMRERRLGRAHPSVANALRGLAAVLADLGEHQAARRASERCLAIREQALGPMHPYVASASIGLARAEIQLGVLDQAGRLLARAREISDRALGVDHPDRAVLLLGLAELALARGRPDDAVSHLEGALAMDNALYRAEIQILLARALWAGGGDDDDDDARARAAVEWARQHYDSIDHRPGVAECDRLLAAHAQEDEQR